MTITGKNDIPEEKTENKVSFGEMNFQVGTRMQLMTYGTKKNAYYSSLIGFEPDRYILIRAPQENGFAAPLKIAERIEVRIFTGISIVSFPSCIEYIYQTPRNFVELAFPDNIQIMPLRKDMRINTKMPVKIWQLHNEKLEESHTVTAVDLSITGTMLQGHIHLGEVGDKVGISFSIREAITNENTLIKTTAIIRNCRMEEDNTGRITYKHGVLFEDIQPHHRTALQSFINDCVMQGRQVIVPQTPSQTAS